MSATATPTPQTAQGLGQFASIVAKGTGLQLATVYAWMRAEGGPVGNPLNIGPGDNYGSAPAAAAATVKALHEPAYQAVLTTAAGTTDPTTELTAIADSPWDTGRAGPKPAYLHLLLGSLAANQKDAWPLPLSTAPADNLLPAGTAGWVSGITAGWVSGITGWLTQESATALSYVVLTLLGLALVLFGLLDTFGYSPRRVVTAPARALAAGGGDDIPF